MKIGKLLEMIEVQEPQVPYEGEEVAEPTPAEREEHKKQELLAPAPAD